MLDQHDGIGDATVTRLECGHTNESYALTTPARALVLRRAWPGKPATQIAAEERVLAALTETAPCDIPRIIPTHTGAPHGLDDGRALHLFATCRGEPGPSYLAPGDHLLMHSAMSRLAALHRALAGVPCTPRAEWHWLAERLTTVRAGSLAVLPAETPRVLDRIAALIPQTIASDVQWLHGDYHLGNLLWAGDEVTGIVDFDETGCGSPNAEAAMALFALSRQPDEARFTYDAALWDTGLAGYGAALDDDRESLMRLFCGYQVLIHLAAAQRRLWTLDEGIGFWPCWRTLTT